MMTTAEKIEMYKNKKEFIERISKVFEQPSGTGVESVNYEVYLIEKLGIEHFYEYVIVNFEGGAKSVRNVNGNSNSANFRVIGSLLDGGYYEENFTYESLSEKGFELVVLD